MFLRKPVLDEFKNYVMVELFMDRPTPEDEANRQLEKKLINTIAMPAYVVVTPEGKPLKNFPQMTRDTEEFVTFLQDGQAAFKQQASAPVANRVSP